MPAKPKSKRPDRHDPVEIKQAVARYKAGEAVAELAGEYKVSRPGFYAWIKRYGGQQPSKLSFSDMGGFTSPITIEELRAENLKLKQKLFELMLATGRL
jgi:Transposase